MGQNRGAFIGIECNRYVDGTEQREERQSDGSQHLRETRSGEPLAEMGGEALLYNINDTSCPQTLTYEDLHLPQRGS